MRPPRVVLKLYADEQFLRPAVQRLIAKGFDVFTVRGAGKDNQKISIGTLLQMKLSRHSREENPLLENSFGLIALPHRTLKLAKAEVVFDRTRDRYLWMDVGWDKDRRVHGCLVHIDLIDGKIWIQRDGTEDGIAADLERAGIPKEDIVLGFRPPELRPYTGYAVA